MSWLVAVAMAAGNGVRYPAGKEFFAPQRSPTSSAIGS